MHQQMGTRPHRDSQCGVANIRCGIVSQPEEKGGFGLWKCINKWEQDLTVTVNVGSPTSDVGLFHSPKRKLSVRSETARIKMGARPHRNSQCGVTDLTVTVNVGLPTSDVGLFHSPYRKLFVGSENARIKMGARPHRDSQCGVTDLTGTVNVGSPTSDVGWFYSP